MRNEQHPSFATLVDMVDQRMTPAALDVARRHLETCATCAAEVHAIAKLVAVMRSDTSVVPPPEVVARAKRALRVQHVQPRSRPSVMRRIVAALSFDSVGPQPLMGVRSTQTTGRQLLYHTELIDIDLRVEPFGELWTLAGQILGPCTEGEVEVYDVSNRVRAALNPLCEFSLPPIPSGTFTFVLHLPEMEIEVSPIAIGNVRGSG